MYHIQYFVFGEFAVVLQSMGKEGFKKQLLWWAVITVQILYLGEHRNVVVPSDLCKLYLHKFAINRNHNFCKWHLQKWKIGILCGETLHISRVSWGIATITCHSVSVNQQTTLYNLNITAFIMYMSASLQPSKWALLTKISLLNRPYFFVFKSDHTDMLLFVSLTIILSYLILVSIFPTFAFFCLSDRTSDKRFHHSLSISSLVRNLWSLSASCNRTLHFLYSSPLCMVYSAF